MFIPPLYFQSISLRIYFFPIMDSTENDRYLVVFPRWFVCGTQAGGASSADGCFKDTLLQLFPSISTCFLPEWSSGRKEAWFTGGVICNGNASKAEWNLFWKQYNGDSNSSSSLSAKHLRFRNRSHARSRRRDWGWLEIGRLCPKISHEINIIIKLSKVAFHYCKLSVLSFLDPEGWTCTHTKCLKCFTLLSSYLTLVSIDSSSTPGFK